MCPPPDASPPPDGPPPERPRDGLRRALGDDFARYSGLGLQLGVIVTLFSLGGNWLDQRLGTRPWFLLVGVLLGFVGGTISVVSRVPGSSGRARGGPS